MDGRMNVDSKLIVLFYRNDRQFQVPGSKLKTGRVDGHKPGIWNLELGTHEGTGTWNSLRSIAVMVMP